MFDFLKSPIYTVQTFYSLAGRALVNIFKRPHYWDDVAIQMDIVGVGSLPMVLLIGLFTGAVITLQMARALNQYGASDQVGQIVSITLIRELGPVLTAILIAGRNASGMASELGSMKVTEQIDALVTLSTDPMNYLVLPRVLAGLLCVPVLVAVGDIIGVMGGWLVATERLGFVSAPYLRNTINFLEPLDITSSLTKGAVFGFLAALMGCWFGLNSGRVAMGVGRATKGAVVAAAVAILAANLILTEAFFSA